MAVALDALLVAADVVLGPIAGTFVVAPFLLAVVAQPRIVAIGAAVAVALAFASGTWSPEGADGAYFARAAIVVVGSALACYAAVRRRSAELGTQRLESNAAVGEVVQVSPTAVLGMDTSGVVTLFNPAAEEMFGYRAEEAVGRELAELVIPPELRELHRAGLARVRATGESRLIGRRIDLVGQRADGARFPVALTITRLSGRRPAAFAGFVRDITDEKRAETAHRLRARTAELLATASDYEGTLREAIGIPVPELCHWCWIELPDRSGMLRTAADSRLDGPLPRRVRDWSAALNPPGLERVMETGRPALHPEVSGTDLSEYSHTDEQLREMEELGVTSLMVVPLRAGRRTLGTMAFASTTEGRCYSRADVELAGEIADRVGSAIDNARLYEERARTAATLMASLRPPAIPDLPGWDTAAVYTPAGRTDEVGGDFYDVLATPAGWMLVIGDVIGHGPPAAALTSLARYSIRAAATLTGRAAPTLAHLNDQLRQDGRLVLLSAACVLLDEGGDRTCATVAVAGHPRPILVRDGEPRLVGRTSLVLGATDDAEYVEDQIEIEPGDCLVLYTDGVLDLAGDTDRFGEDRLMSALAGTAATPDVRLERLTSALEAFQAGAQRDDIAVLAAQRTTPAGLEGRTGATLRAPS
ncbi:MAG: SpoIIE family protein phosphatase [Actinomycetota bacterium]|nr:SpoIIE family protein phosphatase [Actinomycetota bacterium]